MKTLPIFLLLSLAVLSLSAQAPVPRELSSEAVRGPVKAEPETPAKEKPGPVAEAAVLRLIRYSGVLRDAHGPQGTGVLGITFALYKEQRGGAPLWLETQNVELAADGRYTVLLGSTQSEGLPLEIFASEEARWLE
ncbi:MAG: hypothetical protein ACRD35_05735, partial [Candidatus Acidiferrales bacterium]